jgi:hypothetical protein
MVHEHELVLEYLRLRGVLYALNTLEYVGMSYTQLSDINLPD